MFREDYKAAMDGIQPSAELISATKGAMKMKKRKHIWVPLAACFIVAILSIGTVCATQMHIWKNLFGTEDQGIETALKYDYVENVRMDYVVSNGVGVKISSVILDDGTFAYVLDIHLDEKVDREFEMINPEDIVIKDENGVVLVGEGQGMLATGGSRRMECVDGKNIKFVEIAENSNHNFPKSDRLYVSLSKINLIDNKVFKTYTGDWAFNIDTTGKFAYRISVPYEGAGGGIDVLMANLTNTSFNFEVKLPEKHTITKGITLTDENGIIYDCKQIGVEDDGYTIRTEFPVSLFNATRKYTLKYGECSAEIERASIFDTSDIGADKTLDIGDDYFMDYAMSNGVGIRVCEFALDNGKFTAVYEIKLPEILEKCDYINFADLKVTDENGNVLYNDLGSLSTSESISVKKIDDTTFRTSITAENRDGKYPSAKELRFSISQIHCLNSEDRVGNGYRQEKIYDGDWQFAIDVK